MYIYIYLYCLCYIIQIVMYEDTSYNIICINKYDTVYYHLMCIIIIFTRYYHIARIVWRMMMHQYNKDNVHGYSTVIQSYQLM